MRFVPYETDSVDFVGGAPSVVPSSGWPRHEQLGEPLVFLAQFACTSDRFNIPGAAFVQLYQLPFDTSPTPIPVVLPADAVARIGEEPRISQTVKHQTVLWRAGYEPDSIESEPDPFDGVLDSSKAGGVAVFDGTKRPGDTFLMQLAEQPSDFNFGTYHAVLLYNSAGNVRCDLA